MKRSEMQELIEDIILDAKGQLTALQLADLILAKQERFGMLPPRTQVLKRSAMTDDDGEILFDEMISVPGNEWEPE